MIRRSARCAGIFFCDLQNEGGLYFADSFPIIEVGGEKDETYK